MAITKTQKLFGLALPGATLLLAFVGAKASSGAESASGPGVTESKNPALAEIAAAYTKHVARSVARSSQTYTDIGRNPFFGAFTRSAPETPLDQLLGEGDRPLLNNGLCPPDMASIEDRYCVDRYEATLVELLPSGEEAPYSSFEPVEGHVVRAVSGSGVFPRGYISAVQAEEACGRSGKRLCKAAEWRGACMGPKHVTYGYASTAEAGRCNDHGRSPMGVLYGNQDLGQRSRWDWGRMNSPALNQVEGTLARSGEHPGCTNDYGVYDMVGNLHEWVAEATFHGGYYLDTQINGEGCTYRTAAHAAWYHDYSTGFRCCSDVAQ